MRNRYLLILAVFLFTGTSVLAQLLTDSVSLDLVRRYVTYTYNLDFADAKDLLTEIKQRDPDHPAIRMLEGMDIYWRNFPMGKSSPQAGLFRREMERCIKECESSDRKNDPEIILTNLCARGLLLQFYADNNDSRSVIPLAAGTYKYIMKAFDNEEDFQDFTFFTGLYNYYREAYPEEYPVYKALAFMFPKGDRISGLKKLDEASTDAIFLRAEASSFLAYIYYGFEKSLKEAEKYYRRLSAQYPDNPLFRTNLIRVLALEGKYAEADQLIGSTDRKITSNRYFSSALKILKAMILEKRSKDYGMAENLYQEGTAEILEFGSIGYEYAAYGYLGLSRISLIKKDEKSSKAYRKMAFELNPSLEKRKDF